MIHNISDYYLITINIILIFFIVCEEVYLNITRKQKYTVFDYIFHLTMIIISILTLVVAFSRKG